MAQYKTYFQDLGIPFHWYVGKESKQLEFSDLTGPEKVKLFQHINISSLLPNSDNHETIQKIWDGFWNITQDLKQDFNHEDVECFKGKVTSWLELFIKQKMLPLTCMHFMHMYLSFFNYIQT